MSSHVKRPRSPGSVRELVAHLERHPEVSLAAYQLRRFVAFSRFEAGRLVWTDGTFLQLAADGPWETGLEFLPGRVLWHRGLVHLTLIYDLDEERTKP